MTALLVLLIIALLAVIALLWCLAGFSRALREKPRMTGFWVRVEKSEADAPKRFDSTVIAFPDHVSSRPRTSATRFRRRGSLNLLILGGFATLISLGAVGFHFMSTV